MKTKIWKIAALVAAAALTLGLLWIGESLVGNPVSKSLAQKAAEKRIAEKYADTDFVLEEVNYSFKDGGYYAHVHSPSSVDSDFSMGFNHWGEFRWDSYEDRVVHKENTARRVEMEYRKLAEEVLSQLEAYDPEGIQYGTLEFSRREALENGDCLPYTMAYEDLELDRVYDVGAMGAQCGRLIFYIDTDDITPAHAAGLMLEIRRVCDQAGLGFRGLDLVLQEPLPEEGPRQGPRINVENFPYEDIYEEGLEERIMKAHTQLEQKYAELDQQKEAELSK